MRKVDAEVWAGMGMLAVLLALGLPVLAGAVDTELPRLWWSVTYAVTVVALVVAALQSEPSSPPVLSRAALGVAMVGSWVLVASAPSGFLSILLVVVAALAVYLVPFGVVLVIVGLNTALLVLAWTWTGGDDAWWEVVTAAALYLFLQIISALSVLSLVREQRLRRELTQAHVELRAATALLEESARTAERLRISRDLHDTVGHSLTVLSLELEAARHREGQEARAHVVRAGSLARELLGEVRTAVDELRTRPADLRGALEQVVRDIPGLEVSLQVADDVEVGEEESAVLVRAVQEIVTNTLRHAEARTLTVRVAPDREGCTVLQTRDDGRGAARVEPGHGLRGLVERFEALGGEVRFDGQRPGAGGFAVTARVPAT
ncbi:sensor histidine kinase [Ornithinimicrobium sufpigmenti]|uniref:sensor histidine kinase n=1 Tax=Ornithinimicrobium sufpigmenti TaxID=2508882 RepID=UPI001EDF65EF|nr:MULTISPECIES: histidine kinase [unclassified Ornithinimicrobium]